MGNSFTKNFYDIDTIKEEIDILEKTNRTLIEKLNLNEQTTKNQIEILNDKNNTLKNELKLTKNIVRELKEEHIQVKYKHDLYKTMNTNLTNMKEELENQFTLLNIKHNNLINSYQNPHKVEDFLKTNNKKYLDDNFEKDYLLEFQKFLINN
tara:strand:+ start:71 stop:526 length:456 start_codon:yes stop_codon:yes gene_type:complete